MEVVLNRVVNAGEVVNRERFLVALNYSIWRSFEAKCLGKAVSFGSRILESWGDVFL